MFDQKLTSALRSQFLFIRAWVVIGITPVALALLLSACQPSTSNPVQSTSPAITFTDCQLSAPGAPNRIAARCGWLAVYEDRTAQSGRQIDLRVALLPAISRDPEPDPLFFLTGGPGQAATESFVSISFAFEQLRRQRDIVLVDQRGTGQSHPLRCPEPERDSEEEDDAAPTDADINDWVQQCVATLDANLALYTTSIAMDDLDDVRAALGYEQINLYGVSYGTRAALTYLQRHPAHVRTIILDGVVPQDTALGLSVAADAQAALDLVFARCAADAACAASFPNLEAEFADLLTTLETTPVTLSFPHPRTGELSEVTMHKETVAVTVRLLSYAPETVALLPLLIHQAAQKEYTPLAAQAMMVSENLAQLIAQGMNLSVICAEDAPFYDAVGSSDAGDTYYGQFEVERIQSYCRTWPRSELPADFKRPVNSNTPALLLSGEVDPVTPPANGGRVAQTLPNSLHIIAPGQGHNVVFRGCIPRLMTDFVVSGSVADLDATCVQSLKPLPFFVRFAGSEP